MEAGGAPIAALACRGIVVRRGATPVLDRVDLDVHAGSLAVMVGPSGTGKTTLLRAIAGLEAPDAGLVAVGGATVDGLPPHRRGIGLVFQEPRLFPHLSTVENVAFPLRLRACPRRERSRVARALLDEVGLAALADRPARLLSGGEQQRVALARALAAEPRVLLLDEPFAAVDPNRRDSLRRALMAIQRERRLTTLLVTHDRAEAAELGDTIAVLLDGRIHQHAEPRAVFERPATHGVARFMGCGAVLRGRVVDGRLAVAGAAIEVPGADGPACFAIRPEHVALDCDAPLRLRVAEARHAGTHGRLLLVGVGIEVVAHAAGDALPDVGTTVGVELPPARLWRIPAGDADAVRAIEVTA